MNEERIFVAKQDFLEIWNIFNRYIEKRIIEKYKPAVKMKMSSEGNNLYCITDQGILSQWDVENLSHRIEE